MALIAVDFESGSSNDRDGLCWWRPSFLVKSASFAWRNEQGILRSCFVDDPTELRDRVEDLKNHSVLVYNASFDISIIRKHFPEAWPLDYVDVMRLRQLRERVEKLTGYGLKNAVKQHLRHLGGYEDEIKAWIRANVPECKKGKEGAHYDKAPREMLAAYNVKDAEATLLLFEAFTKHFAREGFDWTQDHELYCEQVDQMYQATSLGMFVDQPQLERFIEQVREEVSSLDTKFMTSLEPQITNVRERLRQEVQSKYKKKIVTDLPPFNTGSKRHLELLFVDEMGCEVTLTTPKGRPSFKSAHLGLYGVGGKLLEKRGKRLIVQSQAKSLLTHAQEDHESRYHPQLKIVATTSGRLAGTGGVNFQGISRKEQGLMAGLVADDGYVFVESDLSAGEPTVISHYSQDAAYMYANFGGRGKRPFIKDGVLYIDDIYLMYGWVCGMGNTLLKSAWHDGLPDGIFADVWERDPEIVKSYLKKERKSFKWQALAYGYAMQPKKMVIQARTVDNIIISEEQARQSYEAYWRLFGGIKDAADRQSRLFKKNGYIDTPFGFRAYPKAAHSAWNAFIQSQVSSIMILIGKYTLERAGYARYLGVIHDSIVYTVPEERVEDLRRAINEAVHQLNDKLQWTVPISAGFVTGKTWRELK